MSRIGCRRTLLFLTGVCTVGLYASSASAGDYRKGVEAFLKGDRATAILHLDKVDGEKYPHVFYLRGVILEGREAFGEAALQFASFTSQVSESDDLYWPAQAHAAYSLAMNRNSPSALRILALIPAKSKSKPTQLIAALANLVIAERSRVEKFAKASAQRYEYVFKRLDRNCTDAYNGYGRAQLLLSEMGARDRQVSALEKACWGFCEAIRRKDRAVYVNNLGVALYRLDDWVAAEHMFARAADRTSEQHPIHEKALKNIRHVKAMRDRHGDRTPRKKCSCNATVLPSDALPGGAQ